MLYVTYVILGILFLIYLTPLNKLNFSNDLINYPFRAFEHANMTHILANAVSFYGLSFIEEAMGSPAYLTAIVFIWLVSSFLLYAYHSIFPSRKVVTVGFSGVVFGLIVVYLFMLNSKPGIPLAGLLISIIPQVFVPGISYEGHICGVIAGVIYSMLFAVNKYKDKLAIK